jgi:hypothetical protein
MQNICHNIFYMSGFELADNGNETPRNFHSEARMLALAEPNPAARLELLQALIAEGDIDVASFAVAALHEQPDIEAEDQEHPNAVKIAGAQTLVEVLADHELFEDAESVVDLIGSLSPETAVGSITDLLRKGYAGRDNRYLRLDFSSYIEAARVEGQPPRAVVFNYLNGLASYGIDIFDNETEVGRLLSDSLSAVADPVKRDYYYNSVAYSYARGDHLDKAIAAKGRIHDPYWRSSACVQLARKSQELGDSSAANPLMTEACELLVLVSHCDSSCGRIGCNPTLDTKEIEVGMAFVLAKQGQQMPARELVGPLEPAFAYDQALVHTELYKTSGNRDDRAAALTTLANSSVFQRESLAGTIITDIGMADWQWGNAMPSLDADDETVPLICWELHGLYAQKHRLEQKLEAEGLEEEGYRAMELLGIEPSSFLSDIPERRGQLRDHGLAVLVKLLSSTGAPKTAKSMLSLIESPVEKVRAMSVLGRL